MPGDVNFGQLWKPLQVYAPKAPALLLKQFVNNAYSRALAAYDWSEMRGSGAYALPAPYTTGTVSLTSGSPTVTGSGTAWTSALATKQLVVGSAGPFWDVATIDSPTSLTLATPYGGPDVSGSAYAIQDIYLIVPSDFQHFTKFADMDTDWWVLDRSMIQEVLDQYDPRRTAAGSRPVQLVNATPSPFTATLGRARYELWPRPPAAQHYFFRYDRRLGLLSDDADTIIFPLRGDTIREGAFEDLALWPGTESALNPYNGGDFTARAAYHGKRFAEGVALAKVEDREVRSTAVQYREEFKKLFPRGSLLSPSTVTMFMGLP